MNQANRSATANRVVTPGFVLEPIGTSNRWVKLSCEKCPKSTRFVNASPDRVAWYGQIHRHGPAVTAWHTNEPADLVANDPAQLTNVMNALCFASRLIEHTPRQAFGEPNIYAACETLAGQLDTALAFAHRSRLRLVTEPSGSESRQ